MNKPFSLGGGVVALAFVFISFQLITPMEVNAATPNPGHPWTEIGDGLFSVSGPTGMHTYSFPDANATVLTTNAAVSTGQGGTGFSAYAVGDLLFATSTSALAKLNAGSAGQVLTMSGGVPTWQNSVAGFADPMTTRGDLIYRSSTSTTRLPLGAAGKVLKSDGTDASWATLTNSDVGLGNVENIALSSWNGSTNVTTLGTVASGTWNGTNIAWAKVSKAGSKLSDIDVPAYTGNSGKFLTTDGSTLSWDTPTSSATVWGAVTGTLSSQGDLSAALSGKEPTVTTGTALQYYRGDKSWQTLDATSVGLGAVENIALSSWSGSANLTTLGAISSASGNVSLWTNNVGYLTSSTGLTHPANAAGMLTNDGSGNLSWTTPTSSSQWTTSSTDISYVTGNVGIGTTNPTALLSLYKSVNDSSPALYINAANEDPEITIDGSGATGGGTAAINLTDNSQAWQMSINGAFDVGENWDVQDTTAGTVPLMVEHGTGNVGIGTMFPTAALDLSPATTTHASLRIRSSAGTDPSSPNIGDLWYNDTNLNFRKSDGTTQDLLSGGASSSQWITSGSDISYVTGNVGIGTDAPSSTLDVNGPVTVRGSSTDWVRSLQIVGSPVLGYGQGFSIANTNPGGGDYALVTTDDSNGEGGGHLLFINENAPYPNNLTLGLLSTGHVIVGPSFSDDGTGNLQVKGTETITDSLGIGTASPRGPLDVQKSGAAVAATGMISASENPTDGYAVTITDADGATATFEFDDDATVTPGNVSVTIGAGQDDTLTNLATEISANLNISASFNMGDERVYLTDNTAGISGNVNIVLAAHSIYVTGMSGGMDIANYDLYVDGPTGNLITADGITAIGDVGIGTAGPAAKLHVAGDTIIENGLTIGADYVSTAGTGELYLGPASGGKLTIGNAGGAPEVVFDGISGVNYFANGSLGIGTTTTNERLEVNGGMRLNTTDPKPTCDATHRGTQWFTQGGAGVKDTLEVCAKDATNTYAWRTIY